MTVLQTSTRLIGLKMLPVFNVVISSKSGEIETSIKRVDIYSFIRASHHTPAIQLQQPSPYLLVFFMVIIQTRCTTRIMNEMLVCCCCGANQVINHFDSRFAFPLVPRIPPPHLLEDIHISAIQCAKVFYFCLVMHLAHRLAVEYVVRSAIAWCYLDRRSCQVPPLAHPIAAAPTALYYTLIENNLFFIGAVAGWELAASTTDCGGNTYFRPSMTPVHGEGANRSDSFCAELRSSGNIWALTLRNSHSSMITSVWSPVETTISH